MEDNYISREKKNNTFSYFYIKGNKKERINDKKTMEKISKIYIAPAYKEVKIFLNRNIDKLKRHIQKDLKGANMNKNKLIALILRIMDLCNFRGGNKKYEEKYGSHGLTTLHKKHIKIKANSIEIDFIGKKGVQNQCILNDKPVQDIIKKVYNLSSKDNPYLFSIKDSENPGKNITVSLGDLNNYLAKFDVTTKDLRTWNANIIFLKNFKREVESMIHGEISYDDKTEPQKLKIRKKMIKEAIIKTAVSLHHTPAICKSSYICKNIIKDMEEKESIFKGLVNKNIVFEDFLKNLLKKYRLK